MEPVHYECLKGMGVSWLFGWLGERKGLTTAFLGSDSTRVSSNTRVRSAPLVMEMLEKL